MAFCGKCGTQVDEGVKFCPGCGAPMEDAQQAETQQPEQTAQPEGFGAKVAGLNNTPDTTGEYDPADIAANKGMAVLAYFGPLALIPFFAKKDSKYAQFHAKQGMNLLIVWIGYVIVDVLLGLIKIKKTGYVWGVPYEYYGTPAIVGIIVWLLAVAVSILAIIGIVNAVKGKAKELPLIGKIKLFK